MKSKTAGAAYKTARGNLLAMLVLTAVNTLLALTGSDRYYLFTDFAAYIWAVFARGFYDFTGEAKWLVLGAAGAVLVMAVYFLCWLLSKKRRGWLTAALLCRVRGIPELLPAPPAAAQTEPPPALDTILAQAAVTYLKLCGFVLYFRLLAAGCGLLLPAALAPFPAMLLEVCSGCDYAARTGLWASGLCCAALSVQGASVLLQVRTLCPPEVSFKPLLWGRALHLPLSLALFYLGLPERAVESFNTLCNRVVPMRRVPTDCALLVFAVCCITACEACRLTEKRAQNAAPANKNRSAACKPPQNVVT